MITEPARVLDALREEYAQGENDHDRNPDEQGFVEWLGHSLLRERELNDSRNNAVSRESALAAAVQLMASVELETEESTIRDLEQITIGMAERFAEWTETGRYDHRAAGQVHGAPVRRDDQR